MLNLPANFLKLFRENLETDLVDLEHIIVCDSVIFVIERCLSDPWKLIIMIQGKW